jgi:hypothetical protein
LLIVSGLNTEASARTKSALADFVSLSTPVISCGSWYQVIDNGFENLPVMLARFLEKLLDAQERSPQVQTLLTLAAIAVSIALMFVLQQPLPTCQQEAAKVRTAAFREIIQRKELNVRHEYQLIMIRNFNQQVGTPDLRFFYNAAFCRKMDSVGVALLPFDKRLAASLPVFAQATDSLIKRRDEFTIQVRRGNRFYLFEYRCPWSNPTL